MQNGKVYSGNVGDSRSILCSVSDGISYSRELTIDHKPSNPNEKMRIEASGGEVHKLISDNGEECGPYRVWIKGQRMPGLAISRSFGDTVASSVGVNTEPDVNEVKITPQDKALVIASDGVWDMLSNEEITKVVIKFALKNQPEKALSTIINEARRRWEEVDTHIDDISCIVVVLNSEF